MNPYIEILRPGNVIMAVIAIVLVAIVGHTVSLPIILAMLAVFFEISAETSSMIILIIRLT